MSETSPLLQSQNERPSSPARNQNHAVKKPSRLREIALFAWALAATAAVIIIAVWAQHEQTTRTPPKSSKPSTPAKRNLIFMVSDGMGPASLTMTRNFRQYVEGLPENDTLVLDKHFWGTSRTRSSSSLVTDSAAGATAFSCGLKSYNGAISVTPDYEPCGSVMEAAKRAGYTTGLVVTTDITDATPACFVSHVLMRTMQDDIATQEIGDGVLGRSVDLMMGGGRCHFLPNTTEGGCREDDLDVTKLAQEKFNWTYASDRAGFDELQYGEQVKLPFMGLFAGRDIPFELDRRQMNEIYPSLSEMATTALRALEKATADSDKGFFLMIEASRIDHAGHINDPAAQVREVLEYDKAFGTVVDFLNRSDTEGVLVATSDHETGGLATAIQKPGHLPVYNWYPQVLANATASCEYLAATLNARLSTADEDSERETLKEWINREIISRGLGISDATDAELNKLIEFPDEAVETLATILSFRAHIGWSSHGHTAVDVNIYSSGGEAAEALHGNRENTDVGKFLRSYLDVDVDSITLELKEKLNLGQLDVHPLDDSASYNTLQHL